MDPERAVTYCTVPLTHNTVPYHRAIQQYGFTRLRCCQVVKRRNIPKMRFSAIYSLLISHNHDDEKIPFMNLSMNSTKNLSINVKWRLCLKFCVGTMIKKDDIKKYDILLSKSKVELPVYISLYWHDQMSVNITTSRGWISSYVHSPRFNHLDTASLLSGRLVQRQ